MLVLMFIICHTLSTVSTNRLHSWVAREMGYLLFIVHHSSFIVHCSLFNVHCSLFIGAIMVANVTVLYDPNVAVDHAVVNSLLRSRCIDTDITSIMVMFNNGEEFFFFPLNLYGDICLCMFNDYFIANL